jgi:hypothetical protein
MEARRWVRRKGELETLELEAVELEALVLEA